MSKVGMGMVYTKTTNAERLRRELSESERCELRHLYDIHHAALESAVDNELAEFEEAMIVDCHSFPSIPLKCEQNQDVPRPDICIGTDEYHTPAELVERAEYYLRRIGYTVEINKPYVGTMVPQRFFDKDDRVKSIMIEVNRRLYMDESSGKKLESFQPIVYTIKKLLSVISGREEVQL